jgi:hypothetical protein
MPGYLRQTLSLSGGEGCWVLVVFSHLPQRLKVVYRKIIAITVDN